MKKERVATKCICCSSSNLIFSPAILMPFLADRIFNWKPVNIDESWGLRTVENGMAYCICNSVQCQDCQALFLDLRFSDLELERLYQNYRQKDYNDLREKYEPGYSKRNKILNSGIDHIEDIETFLHPHLKFPLKILDWGGDTGRNTPFKNNNLELDIYDVNCKKVLDYANSVTKDEAGGKKYDLIVSNNVLEHVPYPSEMIIEMKKSMKKDTVLYIEVPHEEIMRLPNNSPSCKRHWHEHINFFSKGSIIKMLEVCGLKVINMKEMKVKAGYIFQVAAKKF